MKKKVISLVLCAALLIVAVIGGTLAYFTDSETKNNVFTVGNVDITLTEDKWDESKVTAVEPGKTYDKNPTVNNVGANDAWIRVNVTATDYKAFAAACAAHEITDLTEIFNGFSSSDWTLAGAPVVDEDNDTVTYSYYYKEALAPNASAGPIFESVTIPSAFTNTEMEALEGSFTITVSADAIQTSEDYDSAADAFANYTAADPAVDKH